MAAITAIMHLFSTGDHLIITDDVYGGTYRLMTKILERQDISVSFVDTSNMNDVEAEILPETKAIFIETQIGRATCRARLEHAPPGRAEARQGTPQPREKRT